MVKWEGWERNRPWFTSSYYSGIHLTVLSFESDIFLIPFREVTAELTYYAEPTQRVPGSYETICRPIKKWNLINIPNAGFDKITTLSQLPCEILLICKL
jgi:hypothetical protein